MTTQLSATQFQDTVVKTFATMALAIADENLEVGDVILVKDRADSIWDVVLSSGVTENGYDIVQGVGVGTLSFVLRLDGGNTSFRALGAVGDGATNVGSLLARADALLSDGATLFGHPDDDYLTSGFRTFTKKITIDFQGATISSAALSNTALLFTANARVLNGVFDNVWISFSGSGVDYGYVNNNRFINQTYYPIGNQDGAQGIVIDGNYFTGQSNGPAGTSDYPCFQAVQGCGTTKFINNTLIDVNAAVTWAGLPGETNCDTLLIANNRMIDLRYYVCKPHQANNVTIENNYVENAYYGLLHQSLDVNSQETHLSGNQMIVRNNWFKNVQQCMRGSSGNEFLRSVFADNYMEDCDFGVYRQTGHTIVTGNHFYNGGALVYHGADPGNGNSFSSRDLTVENNVIQNSGDLSSFTLGSDTDGVPFMGCIVVGALTDSDYRTTVTIRNNTFNEYHTYGIMVVSLGSQYPRVTITDNKFEAGANSTYHMSIGASRDLILKHNKEITAPSSGVEVFFPRIDRHVGFPQYRDNDWQFAAAAPTTKTWLLGSIQTHSAPASAGNIGWVNVFSFSTTLTASEPSGETSMAVTSGTGTANGDIIGVMLDSGSIHWTTISSGGGTTTIVLTSGLTGDAASGKRVYVFRWKSYGTIA